MVPFKSSYFRSTTWHAVPICFPTSYSVGHPPWSKHKLLQFHTLSQPDTRHTEEAHQNRKLPSRVATQPPSPLATPSTASTAREQLPLHRVLVGTCVLVLILNWTSIKGGNSSRRNQRGAWVPTGTQKHQVRIKEQMAFFPEKYQEYFVQ